MRKEVASHPNVKLEAQDVLCSACILGRNILSPSFFTLKHIIEYQIAAAFHILVLFVISTFNWV
jgi:hypothetical protein